MYLIRMFFFFSSRRRHTRFDCDWSSDVCSSDLCVRNPLPCAKLPSTPCACALIRRFAHHFLAALARLWSVPARSVAFCVSVAAGFPPCLCRNRGLSIRCSERRGFWLGVESVLLRGVG